MNYKFFTAKSLTKTAIISALYVILTVFTPAISYGPIQLRISESLCVLPLFMGEAIIGLTIGCFVSNIFSFYVLDIVFGTISTLFASLLTYYFGKLLKNKFSKFFICGSFPVIINALVVPATIYVATKTKGVYLFNFCSVFIGELLAVYVLGGILYISILKRKSNEFIANK